MWFLWSFILSVLRVCYRKPELNNILSSSNRFDFVLWRWNRCLKDIQELMAGLWPYRCLSFTPSLPPLLPEILNNLSRECNSRAVEHFLADSRKLLWVPHHTPNLWDFRCCIQTLSLSPLPFSSYFRVLGGLHLACKPPGEGKVLWLHVHCLPHSWHAWGAKNPGLAARLLSAMPLPPGITPIPSRGGGGDGFWEY